MGEFQYDEGFRDGYEAGLAAAKEVRDMNYAAKQIYSTTMEVNLVIRGYEFYRPNKCKKEGCSLVAHEHYHRNPTK